jgi:hypothetical protein
MTNQVRSPAEDDLAAWLSARDEELAAGGLCPVAEMAKLPEELQLRLAHDLECVQLRLGASAG